MPSIYRISRSGREPSTDVDSVEAVEGAIRIGEPGRLQVDEIGAEPLSSGHTSRRWWTAIKRLDGAVATLKAARWRYTGAAPYGSRWIKRGG
jgi:hypothetical protein